MTKKYEKEEELARVGPLTARVLGHDLPRRGQHAEVTAATLLNTIDGAVWAAEFCRITGFGRVGDARLGEWTEHGETAFHLRRRLTEKEMRLGSIDAVCDVRGTPEYARRIQIMRPFLPAQMRAMPDEAFP